MKKIILLCISLALAFTGCTKKNTAAQPSQEAQQESSQKIDVDFSYLNFNMASAQVFEMLINSEEYLGKRIKIKGKFYTSEAEFGRTFSVLYYDATQCCQTGLSFIREDGAVFPDDYPEKLADIEVIGIYREKDFDGISYPYIDCESVSF